MTGLVKPIGIFFDMDGTLIDSYGFLMKAHNHVRTVFELPSFTEDEFLFNLSRTTREVYRELYGEQEGEARDVLKAYIESHQEERIVPMKGAREMLEFFHAQGGVKLGVVSNMTPALLRSQIAILGWEHYFGAAVVGAWEAGKAKPDAEPLFLAAERAGLAWAPERIWMVGDTETDLGCARAAGCVGILLKSRRDWETIVRTQTPHLAIANLSELSDLFPMLAAPCPQADEILAPG